MPTLGNPCLDTLDVQLGCAEDDVNQADQKSVLLGQAHEAPVFVGRKYRLDPKAAMDTNGRLKPKLQTLYRLKVRLLRDKTFPFANIESHKVRVDDPEGPPSRSAAAWL